MSSLAQIVGWSIAAMLAFLELVPESCGEKLLANGTVPASGAELFDVDDAAFAVDQVSQDRHLVVDVDGSDAFSRSAPHQMRLIELGDLRALGVAQIAW